MTKIFTIIIMASMSWLGCSTAKKEVLPPLVGVNSFRMITSNYYHPTLRQKQIRPKSFYITRDTVVINGKEDQWAYSVIKITEDTDSSFVALIRGGHTVLDKQPNDLQISVTNEFVNCKKLGIEGASWFDVKDDIATVLAFEKQLEAQGYIFHK